MAMAQPRQEYVFTNLSTSNGGLATNLLNSIAQDEKGFMWFATYNGLQRFDGNKFLTFRNNPGTPTSIPTNNLQTLFSDKDNRLWLAANNNKVGFFHTTQFFFKEIPIQARRQVAAYIPKHFIKAHDGHIRLYEEKGNIYRLDGKSNQFVLDTSFLALPTGWKQNRITWDSMTHKYWVGCDSGLVLYNPANRQVSYRGHNAENDPVIKRFENERGIGNVLVNANHTVTFYTRHALFYQLYSYNRQTGKATVESPGQKLGLNFYEIHGMFQQRNGRTWVHGVKLFAQWRPSENVLAPVSSFHNAENKIKSNYVNIVFEDRENNLWAATDNGLFVFNPDAQLFYSYRLGSQPVSDKTEENDILTMSTFQTRGGQVFAGSWKAGLFLFDKHFNPIPLPKALQTLPRNITIWSIHEHSKTGLLYFSVEDGDKRALVMYDPKKETMQWITNAIVSESAIMNFEEDNAGNLWMGTRGGQLLKWDQHPSKSDTARNIRAITKVPGLIRKLYKDGQGYLWVVAPGSGLLKINPQKNSIVKTYTEGAGRQQLTGNNVIDALQYNDSTLLVATETSLNLIHLQTDSITSISTADGLPAHTIRTMQKDQQGIIWLGLLGGICRVNLENKAFTIYDRKDGIPYDNFVAVRGLSLQDGKLLFCTSENLLVIDPAKAVMPGKPTHPLITSFYLANKPLPIDSLLKNEVRLNYDNSSISIGFNNLSYLKQRTLRYYYKLEGLDKDWVQADAIKQAHYPYIPPGHYTFHVKVINEDGVSSTASMVVPIVVRPPFWKTGLFYGILTLVGLLILFLIDRERTKRLRTVQQMRSQLAGDLHKDIHVTLNDINVLSAMAKIKADKDIDRSKDFIDTISIKSRDIMESMEDILWTLDPDNDSIKKMLLRIQEYTEGIKNAQKATIEFTSGDAIRELSLDMRRRHEFLLFYKHALSFILKKVHYPTIRIFLDYGKGQLTLRIHAESTLLQEDNLTAHLSEEEMYKRAEVLKAELQIEEKQTEIAILLQLHP